MQIGLSPTIEQAGARRRHDGLLSNVPLLLGLAAIFAANAVLALVDPGDFRRLVSSSRLTDWLALRPPAWISTAIAVHDGALAAGLVAAVRLARLRRVALAWSGVWLGMAAAIKLTAM